jgi:hypothetical protein
VRRISARFKASCPTNVGSMTMRCWPLKILNEASPPVCGYNSQRHSPSVQRTTRSRSAIGGVWEEGSMRYPIVASSRASGQLLFGLRTTLTDAGTHTSSPNGRGEAGNAAGWAARSSGRSSHCDTSRWRVSRMRSSARSSVSSVFWSRSAVWLSRISALITSCSCSGVRSAIVLSGELARNSAGQ